ncbi:uncharacterized protein LOC134235377 [Saccostrea cucullata]|uniref:uncharacterized protein LOC134235377 n=1 Tax=Saccostrea cuccullata TaxID=36930 RepID=UPI002ED24230
MSTSTEKDQCDHGTMDIKMEKRGEPREKGSTKPKVLYYKSNPNFAVIIPSNESTGEPVFTAFLSVLLKEKSHQTKDIEDLEKGILCFVVCCLLSRLEADVTAVWEKWKTFNKEDSKTMFVVLKPKDKDITVENITSILSNVIDNHVSTTVIHFKDNNEIPKKINQNAKQDIGKFLNKRICSNCCCF